MYITVYSLLYVYIAQYIHIGIHVICIYSSIYIGTHIWIYNKIIDCNLTFENILSASFILCSVCIFLYWKVSLKHLQRSFSEWSLMQTLTTHQSAENSVAKSVECSVANGTSIPPSLPKAQALWCKRNQKNCKIHISGRTIKKECLLDKKGPQHSWTPNN